MSNSFFQFKQFIIHQEHCAMKVCTDACLFGAWVAGKLDDEKLEMKNTLDVGTGTGLLSLMIAQQSATHIDAVELDEAAAGQAADNFELSLWKDRLQVLQGDARYIHLGRRYELIISNPPFFESALKSPDQKRNLALHSEMLQLEELIAVVKRHLAPGGYCALLLPYERKDDCISIAAAADLFAAEVVAVRQSPQHGYFRSMFWFSDKAVTTELKEITIRGDDDYSDEFKALLQPYYLALA